MNEKEWDRMRATEDELWWYRSLHRSLLHLIPNENEYGTKPGVALDVGCGTGGFMQKLVGKGYQVVGFDISPAGTHHTFNRNIASVLVADANKFPFKDDHFDVVTCLDVLESEGVSPRQLVAEAWRVLKPGGYGLFEMAALQWLLSEHDRAVHSARRFNKQQLLTLLQEVGFDIIHATYLFFVLFPILALWKLMNPPKKNLPRENAISDVRLQHPFLNQLFYTLCLPESIVSSRIALPIGTSVCALVKKHE